MWKLTIEDDEGQRTELDLVGSSYTIGRSPDQQIRLTERNVSRRHAILKQIDQGWAIEDPGSYNGTYCNGDRVTTEPMPISPTDIVQLGDYRLELRDSTIDQPPAPAPQQRPDRLVCVIGPVPGVEFALVGDRMSMGRAEEASISINHASVSRFHAELAALGDGRWEIIDKGSANGVRINGVELRQGILEPGDALEVGDVRLRFVAAGKFYRPRVDLNAQLPAVVPAGAHQGGFGKIAVAIGLVGVLIVVGVVMFTTSGTDTTSTATSGDPMATSEAAAKVLFDEAAKIAEDDIEMAHRLLKRIPANSPLRESDAFKELEDRWAKAYFEKAMATEDKNQRRDMLYEIADTTSVSPKLRNEAFDEASKLGPPPADRPRPNIPPVPDGPRPTPTTKTTKTTTATKSETPSTKATSTGGGKFNESTQKQRLMSKLMGGTATETELRMLKAICMNDGDRTCRNAAVAALKAKKNK